MGVNAKVTRLVAQAAESLDPNQVPRLMANGRTHDGDGFAVTRVVTELVEDLRENDRLRRACIHDEPKRSTKWLQWPPDTAIDVDQIVARPEPCDRHGTTSAYGGGTRRPVKNAPTSL
jgi:hypothetical protein